MLLPLSICLGIASVAQTVPENSLDKGLVGVASINDDPATIEDVEVTLTRNHVPFLIDYTVGGTVKTPPKYAARARWLLKRERDRGYASLAIAPPWTVRQKPYALGHWSAAETNSRLPLGIRKALSSPEVITFLLHRLKPTALEWRRSRYHSKSGVTFAYDLTVRFADNPDVEFDCLNRGRDVYFRGLPLAQAVKMHILPGS